MRIDAHHHLWDLNAVDYPWLNARGVARFFGDPSPIQRDYLLDEFRRDATGFGASVHIQVGAADGWAEAQWVQNVADANPSWPMKQVVFVDLTADDIEAQLERFQSLSSVAGMRQIVGRAPGEDAQTGTNDLLENPHFIRGLKAVAARGLSFDLQLTPELYAGMARVLEQCPDLRVALCHAGSPHDRSAAGLATWADKLRLLSESPNVICKLSGLGMFDHNWSNESIRPIIETCLDQFGAERAMFGSNFPVDSLYSDYHTLRAAMETLVPLGFHSAVFGQTARDFYGFSRL